MAAALQCDGGRETRNARTDDKELLLRHPSNVAPRSRGTYRSNTNSVLVAVATTAPAASVTTPSAKPTRDPAFTTVPVAVSSSAVQPHRLQVVHLDLHRGVALALRQRAVDRTTGHRVQQRADQTAVHGPDRVVRRFVGLTREDHPSRVGGDHLEAHAGPRSAAEAVHRPRWPAGSRRPAIVRPLAVLGPGSCQVTVRDRCGPQSSRVVASASSAVIVIPSLSVRSSVGICVVDRGRRRRRRDAFPTRGGHPEQA